ncbi:MAG: sterol desaturase family protein [Planctomycetota bacterium]|nr:sterol desaturase family protein [Planctomycetota bacterium]
MAQVFLAVLVADLFLCGTHRLFHSDLCLWRFHAVHHGTRSMGWLAGAGIDVIATRMMVYLPLCVLGFDQGVCASYVAIVATQAAMSHTNTRLPCGPLAQLIVSPRIHHWRHSTEEQAHKRKLPRERPPRAKAPPHQHPWNQVLELTRARGT